MIEYQGVNLTFEMPPAQCTQAEVRTQTRIIRNQIFDSDFEILIFQLFQIRFWNFIPSDILFDLKDDWKGYFTHGYSAQHKIVTHHEAAFQYPTHLYVPPIRPARVVFFLDFHPRRTFEEKFHPSRPGETATSPVRL